MLQPVFETLRLALERDRVQFIAEPGIITVMHPVKAERPGKTYDVTHERSHEQDDAIDSAFVIGSFYQFADIPAKHISGSRRACVVSGIQNFADEQFPFPKIGKRRDGTTQ